MVSTRTCTCFFPPQRKGAPYPKLVEAIAPGHRNGSVTPIGSSGVMLPARRRSCRSEGETTALKFARVSRSAPLYEDLGAARFFVFGQRAAGGASGEPPPDYTLWARMALVCSSALPLPPSALRRI